MRSFFSFLYLVGAACSFGACSSGNHSSGDASGGPAAARACDAFWSLGASYDPYTKKGTATVTIMGEKSELKELRCLSRRNAEGAVVGYAVSFADTAPKSGLYTEISFDDYKGDGVYSKDVYASWRTKTGFRGHAVSLTVSDDGKHGIAVDKDGDYRLEYDCDASDDTKASASAPFGEPEPGTAQVTKGDAVYAFEGVECAYNAVSEGFDIMYPTDGTNAAYSFEVTLDSSEPGQQRADLWFEYFQISSGRPVQGSLTMSCGKLITGTFLEGGSASGKPVAMKFACPIQNP